MARAKTWRACSLQARRSQIQLLRALDQCGEEELDERLAAVGREFPGSCIQVVRHLCHQRGWYLSQAARHVEPLGFRAETRIYLDHESLRCALTRLSPACFEAAHGAWERLEAKTREWLSGRLVWYWRSSEGTSLTSEWIQDMRPVWELVAPPQGQRLGAERACGLGWPQKETEALLQTHVDLNGDTCDLVRELLQRGMLSPGLLAHQGVAAGLLAVDERLAVEKLLAGEISLARPQATLARRFAAALARWDQELTAQNVKHLGRFVGTLCSDLPQASNATYQMIDSLVELLPRLPAPERLEMLGPLSGLYLDGGGVGRTAMAPHPDSGRGGGAQRRCLQVDAFKAFLERAIGCLDLGELTSSVRACRSPLGGGLRDRFHRWAMEQLEERQKARQLLSFVEGWLVRVCSPEQVLSFWLRAVDCLGSWSFLLASLPTVAAACHKDGRLYERVYELLALEPHAGRRRREAVLLALAEHWPGRLAEQLGIGEYLELRRRSPGSVELVARESHELSSGAVQINDHLQPERELGRVLGKYPALHLTKTREEFALVVDWVTALDARLLCDADAAERMSQILCAKWSDKGTLLSLCGTFTVKLLECLEATRDAGVLVRFVAKCPNLGSKPEFLARQLGLHAARAPVELPLLHPLLAAVATCTQHLVELLHALGCRRVTGETQHLFYELLAREETPERRTQWLKQARFSLPPEGAALDECVECDGWAQVEAWAAAAEPAPTAAAATAAPSAPTQPPERLLAKPPGVLEHALYGRFGPRGEAMVHEFLASAHPAQVAGMLTDAPDFLELCRAALGAWRPAACPPEQVDALLAVVERCPEIHGRAAPLVWAAGEERQVRAMLALSWALGGERVRAPVDLDALPRRWWHCLHWPSAPDAAVARALEAGVPVPLGEAAFATRGEELQQLLLEAHGDDAGALADWAPRAAGPLEPYLERVFELLAQDEGALRELGDGVEDEERLLSGWNKMVHRLLLAVRERVKEGNPLHTDEQLLLFRGCTARRCDNTNSTLLADLMETKMVDPQHITPLVSFVLDTAAFGHTVRDSALRAMMRLTQDDRDALHRTLLEKVGQRSLPLQTLFSLVVTKLDEGVLPLVRAQLGRLTVSDWDALLGLIRDANPAGGRDPHTYPRSLAPEFGERFLLRYLMDEAPKRDPRLFLLFVACTPPEAVPGYLLGVLAAQRHGLDALFQRALAEMTLEEFRGVVEFLRPEEWRAGLEWVLGLVVRRGTGTRDGLEAVLDVIGHRSFAGCRNRLLRDLLGAPQARLLLADAGARSLLRDRLPDASAGREERALHVLLVSKCWSVGARCGASDLQEALGLSSERPLTKEEVQQLGVDVPACKLMVEMAPTHALPAFGFRILAEEAAFARSLSDEALRQIRELSAVNDAHWATCRRVIGEVEPATGLHLAIALFRQSREPRDLELLGAAYRAADGFTRKQVWLPAELGGLWERFGHRIQQEVIDPTVPARHGICLEVSRVQKLSRAPSTSSWEVVGDGS